MLWRLKTGPHSWQRVKINITKRAQKIQKEKVPTNHKTVSRSYLDRKFWARIRMNCVITLFLPPGFSQVSARKTR
jgi:hypothetical protein